MSLKTRLDRVAKAIDPQVKMSPADAFAEALKAAEHRQKQGLPLKPRLPLDPNDPSPLVQRMIAGEKRVGR